MKAGSSCKQISMTKKVLILDDDEDILDICRFILEAKGYEVQVRSNCSSILEDLKIFHPDVVIMDNWIPDTGGIEATRKIKRDSEFNSTPVILFTASKNIQKLAQDAGADAFLEKPFNIELLEKLVEDMVNRQ